MRFSVNGDPKPQGSKKGFVTKSGKVALVEMAGKPLKDWRTLVTFEARQAAAMQGWIPSESPIHLEAVFRMPRPQKPKHRTPAVRPDLDKLTRALLDSITNAGNVWKDDSQVVSMTITKTYGLPGVTVEIMEQP